MKNKIELIPVNEFGSEITVGGYGFDKFIEKPKQLTDLEIAIKLEEIEREEVRAVPALATARLPISGEEV